jgi:predicted ATPase
VDTELLYQRGRPPRARYLFKHVLIQDAAYASLKARIQSATALSLAQHLAHFYTLARIQYYEAELQHQQGELLLLREGKSHI